LAIRIKGDDKEIAAMISVQSSCQEITVMTLVNSKQFEAITFTILSYELAFLVDIGIAAGLVGLAFVGPIISAVQLS